MKSKGLFTLGTRANSSLQAWESGVMFTPYEPDM